MNHGEITPNEASDSLALCCGLNTGIPAWKYKYCRMALQGSCKCLGAFDTKVYPPSLYCGDCGLGDTCGFRKLILAKFL